MERHISTPSDMPVDWAAADPDLLNVTTACDNSTQQKRGWVKHSGASLACRGCTHLWRPQKSQQGSDPTRSGPCASRPARTHIAHTLDHCLRLLTLLAKRSILLHRFLPALPGGHACAGHAGTHDVPHTHNWLSHTKACAGHPWCA